MIALLVTLAAGYAAIVVVVFAVQRSMLYPVPEPVRTPALADGRLLTLGVGADEVHAFFLPPREGLPVVVHFHGNGEQLADGTHLADALRPSGLGYLGVEYPGYGLSRAQQTTEANVYAAAERALKHLGGELGVGSERMVVLGQSLGSGVAAEMVARGFGARMVLISPYTSMGEMAQVAFPWLPGRWLVRDRYDTEAKVERIGVPVLIVHGEQDELIPVEMGRRLAKQFRNARLEVVPGRGHNDLLTGEVLRSVAEFSLGS